MTTKLKDPKTFEQKHKTIDGKILRITPHTAWVQTNRKQPRLLRNSGFAFVPNALLYGPCRPTRLSDYVADKSARRTESCFRFSGIEALYSPQHLMFREDTTRLPVKLTRKELQENPIKRKAKLTGKRTGGKPQHTSTRGMKFQTESSTTVATPKKQSDSEISNSSGDTGSSTSENTAPFPKRGNKK